MFVDFGKGGGRETMKIRFKILEILDMGPISARKHEMKIW